ncbi:L-seryl-tRNA(Sec) selenium transferase [Fusibacter ferrireducens]|uniref:L-seryl-tRNA(Sec) selenium transferase n=1 Tax=Fusibacter ferrireducens TaxID=2785058 RepID=A0ABR9ZR39_9FIRM|nr:L-seryl-tRNA(Sec) selenium transferase [Fusibacter ferrireducens]MBF4692922.1 L-seryl-tRNA(Sec) selenium transferase [Fusibacter ferrireducens]
MQTKQALLRSIPKVDDVANHERVLELMMISSRQVIMDAIRKVIDQRRNEILTLTASVDVSIDTETAEIKGKSIDIDVEAIVEDVIQAVYKLNEMSLRRVINATGVILHTNLGRASLYSGIKESLWEIAENYSTLEFNIATGKRGSRYDHVEEILTKLTGAEAAMVVNNNAAAVLLILSTLGKGKDVIVSRGELVEIGGAFRIPEIMVQSGANLVEVGTTNKTHLYDYERAIINGETGAFLKVHTSNYRILGFTEEVSLSELATLGRTHDIPVIHDLGSGALIDFSKFGIEGEMTVHESVASGADIICFSGDKLLGGPQAGIIIGKKHWIEQMKLNPLTRAFRIDKLTLAALEATLRLYFDTDKVISQIPLLEMMTMPLEIIRERATHLRDLLSDQNLVDHICLEEGASQVGGGSMPLQELPTVLVKINPVGLSVKQLETHLRQSQMPIIVRIQKDHILLDVRTINERDFEYISNTIKQILRNKEV